MRGTRKLQNVEEYLAVAPGAEFDGLDLTGCAGVASIRADLHARRIDATGRKELTAVRAGLRCAELVLANTGLRELPEDLVVEYRLDARGCVELVRVPSLAVGAIVLRGCSRLTELGAGLSATFLDLQGCAAVRRLPEDLHVRDGRLDVSDCPLLEELPSGVGPLAQLHIAGCTKLRALPETLVVHSWIDVAGTGLTQLPPGCRGAQLRWRGVAIEPRVAFHPESIRAAEVLNERNVEVRRVLLERMGFERFLAEAGAEQVDGDVDPGGPRRLLRVELERDEALVCLAVRCPSTGREYLIRVPPTVQTCRQGAAWIAGFDDPAEYEPLLET